MKVILVKLALIKLRAMYINWGPLDQWGPLPFPLVPIHVNFYTHSLYTQVFIRPSNHNLSQRGINSLKFLRILSE